MKLKIKNLLLVAMVLTLPLFISSCSNDDEETVNNSIVGTWKFEKAIAGEVKTNSAENDKKINDYLINHMDREYTNSLMKLREDGTFIVGENGEFFDSDQGTYTFKGGKLTMYWGGPDIEVFNASIENGVLITEEDFTYQCSHKTLEQLKEIGIEDVNYSVTKASVKSRYVRQ